MKTASRLDWIRFVLIIAISPYIGYCQPTPPGGTSTNFQLNAWYFSDTNLLTGLQYPPANSTNAVQIPGAGDNGAVWIDTTNTTPAFLLYHVSETTNGPTNITFSTGSISMWFNPDWSSTNQDGGTGPGDWANLISTGLAGTNGPWWAWYLSPDGCTVYFSTQTNGGLSSNYFAAPVSFSQGTWVNLVLTYGPTNSLFYTNGVLVTNGTGVAYWPGSNAPVFAIGSDTNGYHQAGGGFDDIATHNYQLDPNIINGTFGMYSIFYFPRPLVVLPNGNAPNTPSVAPTPRWFSGQGDMQLIGAAGSCITNANIWLTNVSAAFLTNGTTSITFTIAGGSNNVLYDVFGTAVLVPPKATNAQWVWLGQGTHCNTYVITNILNSTAFLMLGAAKDTDGDGLPDAFEALVSKTSPTNANTFGLPDAWVALNGLVGNSNLATQDPDLDTLNNGQEYLYGTKPLVNEGTNIWVASPASFSGIP